MLPQPPRATPFPYTTLFRSNQQQALEPLEDDAESAGANPEELLLERVDSDRLRRALDELPREYREVIVLRELEELSYKEIRSEEHTSELQSLTNLVCRLLLE